MRPAVNRSIVQKSVCLAAIAFCGTGALAQDAPDNFVGGYAGAELGSIEHHFYLKAVQNGSTIAGRYFRNWGVGGGAFAGYDFRLTQTWRAGLEAEATFGGDDNVARFANGTELRLSPRYGYRATVRLGPTLGSRTWLYALGGYGGNRYRISNSAGVADVHQWGSSFVVGVGIEHRLSRRLGLRLDYKHVDNQTHEFLVGLPIRF